MRSLKVIVLPNLDKIDTKGQYEVKQTTVTALLDAYNRLQEIIFDLYAEYEKAMQNENYADASLLEARAERLFEEAESIIVVIQEANKWIENGY